MKRVILLWLCLIAAVLASSCKLFAPVPALRTYSISGNIELVNDCDGNGANNPNNIQIQVKLWYTNDTINASVNKFVQVPMVLQADGVTSKGTYTLSDVPTNLFGHRWEIKFPNSCSTIPCTQGTCKNFATNVRQPIMINNVAETYDYRYSCTCN